MNQIVLATTSPYRKEEFAKLAIPFETCASNVDEREANRPTNPRQLCRYLAKKKAQAVAKQFKDKIIIGFDSLGYFDGKIMEKPSNRDEAFKRLKKYSNNKMDYYTGIHIINQLTKKKLSAIASTKVFFREISDAEINKYLNQDDKYNTVCFGFDSAGNYSISFTKKLVGSYTSWISGVPSELIIELLKKSGYKIN